VIAIRICLIVGMFVVDCKDIVEDVGDSADNLLDSRDIVVDSEL
jgi:hypothetical protein